MINDKKVGIALSGGGYRAAGFHIGTLKKLDEMGVLEKVDVLSTISGGSITGAAFCLHHGEFKDFEEKMVNDLANKSVIGYVLSSWLFLRAAIPVIILVLLPLILPFTNWPRYSVLPLLLLIFLIIRFQFRLLPLSAIIEKAYNNFFYNDAILSGLCDQPEIAISATNLQTMRQFTFSKRKMEDSTYVYSARPVYFNNANFPVARAVMASSSIPSFFTPVTIDKSFFCNPELTETVDPQLVDGGVYDNQGVHKITQPNSSYACEIVVVSDAGNLLPFRKLYNNTYTLLLRTVDTFMVRIKNFQMMQNIYKKNEDREIAYLSLGWNLENCIDGFYDNFKAGNVSADVTNAHGFNDEWVKDPVQYRETIIGFLAVKCKLETIMQRALPAERLLKIRQISTNLTCIKKPLLHDLIIHAENLTELQVRLYCPSLIL